MLRRDAFRTEWRDEGAIRDMSLFPMFLKLEGRKCLVVGAGKIGESKIRSLLIAHAEVRVLAPSVTVAVAAWARTGVIAWDAREFRTGDLEAMFLVVAATSSVEVNEAIYREAQVRRVLCNVVDDPERCDFYYPAVVRRGALQVAISTEGQSPALAQRLRREFERQLRPVYAGWLEWLGGVRKQLFASRITPERRRAELHELASRESFELRYPEQSALLEASHER
jgi:precorrin-2 dehydrogenase/sirohydrochlorin ferrochelatase